MRDVGDDFHRLLAALCNALGNFVEFVFTARGENHRGARIRKCEGDAATDTAAGARDDGDHSVHAEQIHDVRIGRVDRCVCTRNL